MRGDTGEFAAFDHAELASERRISGKLYHEFLRVPAMSAGLYELAAGSPDPQRPHAQDEIYYVIEGRARFTAGSEAREVGPGAVLYVRAGVEHRFHDIDEDLSVLVVFAPFEE